MIVSKKEQLKMETGRVVYQYYLTETNVDGEDNIRYTTYGIRAEAPTGDVVAEYADVTTNQDLMQRLVAQCNEHCADVIHLEDIIFDTIG